MKFYSVVIAVLCLTNIALCRDCYINSIRDFTRFTPKSSCTYMKLLLTNDNIGDLSPLKDFNQFTKLEKLDISLEDNQITDVTPLAEGLGSLHQLKIVRIKLDNNQLATIEGLQELAKASSISHLEIDFKHNSITNVDALNAFGSVSNLYYLAVDFTENQIQNIKFDADFSRTELGELYLIFNGNRISDISQVTAWQTAKTSLRLLELYFNENQITSIDVLQVLNNDFTMIHSLDISMNKNHISDLSVLSNLSSSILELDLYFNENNISNLDFVSVVSTMTDISDVDIRLKDNQINSIAPLKTIPGINMLEIELMNNPGKCTEIHPMFFGYFDLKAFIKAHPECFPTETLRNSIVKEKLIK